MCPYSRQSKHLVPLLLDGHFAFRWFLFPHRKHRRTGSLAASSRLVLFDLSSTRLAFVFAFSFVASYRASFSFNFVRHEFRRWCILFFIIFFIIFYYGLSMTHSLHYVEHFVDILLVCLGFLFGSTPCTHPLFTQIRYSAFSSSFFNFYDTFRSGTTILPKHVKASSRILRAAHQFNSKGRTSPQNPTTSFAHWRCRHHWTCSWTLWRF